MPANSTNANVDVVDELDVEAFAKSHSPDQVKPKARFYIVRIDRETKRVTVPSMKGAEILALVGKTPQSHKLYQKLKGGEVTVVEPDQVVDFTAPGVERFQTIPLDTTEGSKSV